MPPGRLPREVFQAQDTLDVSRLAWERLEEVSGEREVWVSLLSLLPRDPDLLLKRNKQKRVHMSSAAETVENASIIAESAAHDGNRLWIGNIDPKITEYHLVKLLEKFGKVKQFDFLFHKSGPLEGQPRGYCFVNFSTREEAERAIQCLNGKLALSKKLVVRWAHAQVRVSKLNHKSLMFALWMQSLVSSTGEGQTEFVCPSKPLTVAVHLA
ncbi:hypothetical protein AMECASPLE_020096 [Ameca splendens]|uniref:Probable RNA-binding protein 18 n=1 Tax=Ameca splendens TaxID=208324 RepID=A0ABV0XS31_9TELE